MSVFRADHCGSLIRPAALRQARLARRRAEISAEALHAAEDQAILDALALQREAGLGIFSDGEFRRRFWSSALQESLTGLDDRGMLRPIERGDVAANPELAIPDPVVVDTLRRRPDTIVQREIAFLQRHAPGPFKITIPSLASVATLGSWFREGVTDRVYATRAAVTDTLIGFLEDDVRAAAQAGVPYIQIDNPRYSNYIGAGGRTAADAPPLDTMIAWDNRLLHTAKRPGITTGVHICLGTYVGGGATTLERKIPYLAEMVAHVIDRLDADVFTIEYTERSAAPQALGLLSNLGGKVIALGMINVLQPAVESADDLMRRIEAATHHIPLENLALCNNCGFAGASADAFLDVDLQRRKLARMVEVANRVWGTC